MTAITDKTNPLAEDETDPFAELESDSAPIHPGEYIREELLPNVLHLDLSQIPELAAKIDLDPQYLELLIYEKEDITPKAAIALSRIEGIDPTIWMEVQASYDLWHAYRGISRTSEFVPGTAVPGGRALQRGGNMALTAATGVRPDLFSRLRSNPDDRTALQDAAQLAIQVEFTTIPAYLTALYSISEPDSAAYQALRSVVVEEMFHVNQAANLLVAIGGLPRFTPPFAPSYPCFLPHANRETTPLIGLYRASLEVFADVFEAIETPAPSDAPPQGDHYNTIAQLYGALRQGLVRYHGQPPLFTPNPEGRQRTDIYLGKFGGKPEPIATLDNAEGAIRQIVQQGEGHVPIGKPLVPFERFGAYNQYGERTDGTYGPIIGTPYELSH